MLHLHANALDHVDRVRVRQNPDAHEDGFLTGEPHLGVVIFRAEHDVGDVAQPNEISLVLANDQLFEIIRGVQIGVSGEIDLKERTLCAADSGEKIVSRKRAAHLRRADIQRCHPIRLHPDAHGESAAAQNVGFLHAADRGQSRLDQAHEIIGDLVRLENVRGETEISGGKLRIGRLNADHRDF